MTTEQKLRSLRQRLSGRASNPQSIAVHDMLRDTVEVLSELADEVAFIRRSTLGDE